ncbi:MAG: hypothetical protein H0T84_13660 [Tatlockia sp.]|nr:hypothetical protein [Tatlockia sp.]
MQSRELKGHTKFLTSVAFSPDGKSGLTGSWDKTARLWDLSTLQSRELKGHTDFVDSVAFSPDGNYALTGSWDKTACLWDVVTLQPREFIGHTSYVSSVAFSPDGKYALTGSHDNIARLWNLTNRDILDLEQLLFIHKLMENKINVYDAHNQEVLESLAPVIDGSAKLPSQSYTTNPLVKAYIDDKRYQLLQAAAYDSVATVVYLLKRGFSLNTCDKVGNNLWHYAFQGCVKDEIVYPSREVLQLLLSLEGTDKGCRKTNKIGLSPLIVGLIYNKEFTRDFIAKYCDIVPQTTADAKSKSSSRCSIQ